MARYQLINTPSISIPSTISRYDEKSFFSGGFDDPWTLSRLALAVYPRIEFIMHGMTDGFAREHENRFMHTTDIHDRHLQHVSRRTLKWP